MKYGNIKTVYNGVTYASKKEAARAAELDLLMRVGEVKGYETQPRFPVEINGKKICVYIADFLVEMADGTTVIEDVKGVRTTVYRLKKKLVEAFYDIEIVEK